MFAVIKTGGKQYRVAEGDKFLVERLYAKNGMRIAHNESAHANSNAKALMRIGEEFDFDQVLLTADQRRIDADPRGNTAINVNIGRPLVEGARVHARVLEYGRGEKKIVFKYHSKTRYKKKKGHRQPYTKVEILKITA